MASDNSPSTLRETFRSTADRLLESLSKMRGPYIERNNLLQDAFAISHFDAEDDTSLESSGWLFRPMPQVNLDRYTPHRENYPLGGHYPGFKEFQSNPHPKTVLEEMAQSPGKRARILERCLLTMFVSWRRNLIRKSLIDKTKWEPVVYPNPFLSREGLLSRYRPPGWGGWVYENTPSFPHIMLLQVQKVSVTEDEMLVGEIGPIVQAIRNRLDQEEFADTTFIPVLVISLSGPQHGRITQGCFDRSGILQIRTSKLYSFETEQEAPFDLFLRFLANTPKGHPEEQDVMA